jgi:hypothetical protein
MRPGPGDGLPGEARPGVVPRRKELLRLTRMGSQGTFARMIQSPEKLTQALAQDLVPVDPLVVPAAERTLVSLETASPGCAAGNAILLDMNSTFTCNSPPILQPVPTGSEPATVPGRRHLPASEAQHG